MRRQPTDEHILFTPIPQAALSIGQPLWLDQRVCFNLKQDETEVFQVETDEYLLAIFRAGLIFLDSFSTEISGEIGQQ